MEFKYKNISGIYVIRNSVNEKIYVGSAVSLYDRYHAHRTQLTRNIHYNMKLQRFVNKYGFDKLKFEVLELCDKENLIKREQHYIDTLKPFYNICQLAGSSLGYRFPQEKIKYLSDIRKGKQTTGMLGKKHTEKTKELIREKAKKRGISENLRLASIKANTGKKHSKQLRDKIAQSQRKISNKQVEEIKELIKQGMYQKDIASLYKVSQRVICRINLGLGVYANT